MELVVIVVVLAILEYMVFSILVGKARGTYGVSAPAISGDPIFERYYRVHQNTLEQLIIFIPAIVIYGYYGNPNWAAGIGLLFLIGRPVYLLSYVKDPAKRGPGFLLGFAANVILLIAGLVVLVGNLL
jgi:glutathione S-transferase